MTNKDTNLTSKPLSSLSNTIALVTAATLSSLPADILTFPISRIKTVMMTQTGDNRLASNTYKTVSVIYRTQGLLGFYRGFTPLITSAIPGTALFFWSVDTTKAILGESVYSAAISGFVGQMAGSIVWVPAEVIRELRQITSVTPEFQKKSVTDLTKYVYRQEGVRGLYRGLIPQFLAYGPFNSIGLSLSTGLHSMVAKDEVTAAGSLGINALSYGVSALLTTPFDVVKTRIQVSTADPVRFPTRSFLGCLNHIVQTQGASTLFSGASLRAGGLGMRQAVAFTLFGKADTMCRAQLSEKEKAFNEPRI